MLKLDNIVKDYNMGDETVHALRGISLELRKNEFVSVLGPSGCGKTTMLNIIGGLDRYTSGDLVIDGKSTRDFKDTEWDSYRNGVIGMVFQNYNLIPHLSVLENVSIALTLSGTGVSQRRERAKQALIDVGLETQMNKRPNQLSGGQMQRVAIARALVNNPDILLADEPTGALDTNTSVQVMEILKKISSSRLVIMVTHNEQLAEAYSDRIVRLVDGKIVDDSSPYRNGIDNGKIEKLKNKKTSMSFWTAVRHSFKNLKTKKARSILTSVAGSIGIMGIALVLALSNGMSGYITRMQSDTMAGFPVTISQTANSLMDRGGGSEEQNEFPDETKIYTYIRSSGSAHINKIDSSYLSYLDGLDPKLYNSVSYTFGLEMNIITKADNGVYKKVSAGSQSSIFGNSSYFSELPDNPEFVNSQYDILASSTGRLPENASEAALVLDSYNRIDSELLAELGINIADDYEFSELIGKEFKIIKNNSYYSETGGIFLGSADYENMYNDASSVSVKITSILRVKESASAELLSQGIVYTGTLTKTMLEDAALSDVALAQKEAGETRNVLTGGSFNALITYDSVMKKIGADSVPSGIQIYPVDFDAKDKVKNYLDAYNSGKDEEDRIIYTDLAESISSITSTLINTITIALAAFAGISLLVSSIMIGIITYVSVVERTKEIGILRAIGARKKDISRLFNAETLIIGFAAGLIGIVLTLILSIPLNMIISSLAGISGIVSLPVWAAFALVALSMLLTFVAGLFPSRIAAKKDPVLALRTE